MVEERYFTAREAAAELGVSVATLYAYVSRGLVRSEAASRSGRDRRYHAEDVRKLRERKEGRRDPARAVEGALHWGAPVMESGVTLISGGRVYYRGRDVCSLGRDHTAEQVAALLWTGDVAREAGIFSEVPVLPPAFETMRASLEHLTPVETFQILLPLAAAGDDAAYDLRPASVARTGARILRVMAAVPGGKSAGLPLARSLREGWKPEDPESDALFDAALIICADHELPVSTFTARCVASAKSTPYAVVLAGISAAQGINHGGQIELIETFLREVEMSKDARSVMANRLRRGERIPGFGHSLYPDGDPRGAALLEMVEGLRSGDTDTSLAGSVCVEAEDLLGERPTVDFGLVTLSRTLGLPRGAALAIFTLGRTIGWIAHAIEQYESGSLIRPRARYVGEQP